MITSTAQLFSAAVAALDTALPDGWYLSPHDPLAFAEAKDGAERVHQSYCLWVPSTEPLTTRQRRNGSTEGMPVVSEFRIRYLYRIRPIQRAVDYAAALDAEATILAAKMNAPGLPTFHAILSAPIEREERPGDAGGHLLMGEMVFNLPHTVIVE